MGKTRACFLELSADPEFLVCDHFLVTEVLSVPIPMNQRVCLLGLVEEIVPSLAHHTQYRFVLR